MQRLGHRCMQIIRRVPKAPQIIEWPNDIDPTRPPLHLTANYSSTNNEPRRSSRCVLADQSAAGRHQSSTSNVPGGRVERSLSHPITQCPCTLCIYYEYLWKWMNILGIFESARDDRLTTKPVYHTLPLVDAKGSKLWRQGICGLIYVSCAIIFGLTRRPYMGNQVPRTVELCVDWLGQFGSCGTINYAMLIINVIFWIISLKIKSYKNHVFILDIWVLNFIS